MPVKERVTCSLLCFAVVVGFNKAAEKAEHGKRAIILQYYVIMGADRAFFFGHRLPHTLQAQIPD